jgi:nicotinamide-nucleotide amidase
LLLVARGGQGNCISWDEGCPKGQIQSPYGGAETVPGPLKYNCRMWEESLEIVAGRLLDRKGLRLAVAESCTGGLIGHRMTNVPGSSEYFSGGVIAYANEVKSGLLGVRPDTLSRYGAVSEQAVLEMARGVRFLVNADLGLSVSGIAGPGGGTPEKPVGLVWIGLNADGFEQAAAYRFAGDRLEIKEQAAGAALQMLVDFIEGVFGQDNPVAPADERGKGRPDAGVKSEERSQMDAIEVTVRFDALGKATPLQFSWRGLEYKVDSTGRRWEDEQGQHILVMIPGGRVFEMLFSPAEQRWYLKRTGERRMFV